MRALSLLTALVLLATPPAAGAEDDWIGRSNANAQVLLEVMARFAPEMAGQFGVDGLDEEVFQLPPDLDDRAIAAMEEAIVELRGRLERETHPAVRQDLEILIDAAELSVRDTRLTARHELPYTNVAQSVLYGIDALLDEQVAPERREAAVVRLRRYAGLEEGYTPIAEQAEAYSRARFDDEDLRGPFTEAIEKDLNNQPRYVAGIREMFERFELEGWQESFSVLEEQLSGYEEFLRDEMVPRATDDYRLPRDLYAFALEQVGVDMPVEELQSRAKTTFRELQNQMQALAPLVAREHGLDVTDYRDVLAALKRDRIGDEVIMTHYRERNEQLEEIIREEGILTLPDRALKIRLATEAESAAIPAPHMQPPRLLGNTGEVGEFVLPVSIPDASGKGELSFDDFNFAAASWTLSAHEARPGHELQFASVIEKGVSVARSLFAFNSVNVEGWALYMEAEVQPYEPLDGQLVALQHRLLRAARAFLDPGLQLGTITREQAYRVLQEDVCMSRAMSMQEVERYTFWAPGQATAYFTGYSRLMELRTDTERELGDRFDRKAFHDFILSQGLLPPKLLRRAVMNDFIPSQQG